MFNLNLLPEKEKQNMLWEKRTNQAFYFGSLVIASVFIFLILLFPSYIFLALQNDDVLRSLELEEKNQEALQITIIENRIATINANAKRIIQNSVLSFTPGHLVEHLSQLAEGQVLITQIQYHQKNGGIIISGWAETRNKFLDFKNALETEGGIRNIISPISNIIKESNIEFSLSGTIVTN